VANEASLLNLVLPGEGVGLKRALRGLLMSAQLLRVCAIGGTAYVIQVARL